MEWFRWLGGQGRGAAEARIGFTLVTVGEALIVSRFRPMSDFYFPFVWLGYVLVLDGALAAATGRSPSRDRTVVFVLSFPLSACFWWLFEALNSVVQNWVYVGGQAYTGVAFAGIASVDFSLVLPAVWCSALVVASMLGQADSGAHFRPVPNPVLALEFVAGLACLALPLLAPHVFFGLIWGATCLLLDPINARLGRPSVIGAVLAANWRLPVSFALGALACGFFWESWNYWAMPKWRYHIPYVGFLHVFEMPLLGYLGYLPFGLELFAMANFVLPILRQGGITEHVVPPARGAEPQRAAS